MSTKHATRQFEGSVSLMHCAGAVINSPHGFRPGAPSTYRWFDINMVGSSFALHLPAYPLRSTHVEVVPVNLSL